MRKNILKAAFAVAAIAAMTLACNKVEEPGNRPDDNGKITIKAAMPESLPSRVEASVPASGVGISWKWQSTDKLTVIGTTTETFTIKSGASSPEAEFEGNPVSGSSFTILYPGTCATLAEAEAIDWTTQKQVGNNSPAHLQYVAALKDVDAYDEFAFTSDWAAAHGGTLKQSGIVKFEFTLPAAVPGVNRIEAAAPGGVFTVGLDLEDVVLAEGNVLTAYAGFPWVDLDIPAGVPITVTLNASDGGVWTKVITFTEAGSLKSGMVNNVKLNASNWTVAEQGTGTEEDPYIIRTLAQFKDFGNKLVAGETRWFKLVADIDLGAETSWAPLHPDADTKRFVFDGQNHVVKNLTASFDSGYASIFGAINGTIKDLKFENCAITYANATGGGPLGILAGWAGHGSNAAVSATVENVHAIGCTVSSTSKSNTVGGLVGRSHNATFKNCSFDGTVERTSTAASGYIFTGGLVGSDEYNGEYSTTLNGCSTSGTLTTKSGNSAGGILGGVKGGTSVNVILKIENCSSTMTITTEGTVIGGIQGYCDGTEFIGCTFDGKIVSSKTSDAYIGGIVPYCYHYAKFTNCHTSGSISAKGNRVSGIIGSFSPQSTDTEALEMTDCSSSMTLTGVNYTAGLCGWMSTNANTQKIFKRCFNAGNINFDGNTIGGLVGNAFNATFEDCYNTGNLVSPNKKGASVGGLIGECKSSTVKRCFSTGTVEGVRGVGGLIGMMKDDTSSSLEKSIFWGASVSTFDTEPATGWWSSAAIVGALHPVGNASSNYRNPAMTLSAINIYADAESNQHDDMNGLFDQDDVSSSASLMNNLGEHITDTAPSSGQAHYPKYPYHGKAAAAGKTAAQVATDLDWSTDVWDLSGSVPTLKKAE